MSILRKVAGDARGVGVAAVYGRGHRSDVSVTYRCGLARPPPPPLTAPIPVRIWDLPTRVFHVALAVLVTAAIVTAKVGGDWMTWHLRCGEAVLALLAFRWAWGVVGGRWSRFASFLPSPGAIGRALSGRASVRDAIGHGALGALSVWAFLLLLSLQVATGLVVDDDIAITGPLNGHVAGRVARRASDWHAGWGADLVIALVALHLLAVAWYTLRGGASLLRAMWTGDKPLPAGTPASRDGAGQRLLALALWALAAAGVWALLRWAA